MRPPVLPSGNRLSAASETPSVAGFNEAAGFTQRKQRGRCAVSGSGRCFNEAAGFTQRKHVGVADADGVGGDASMRPPVLPSGNRPDSTRDPLPISLQ